MGRAVSEAASRRFLLEAIGRIVANAAAHDRIVRTGEHARRLAKAYPEANLSVDRLADEIMMAAAAARVPVEIGNGPLSLDGAASPISFGGQSAIVYSLALRKRGVPKPSSER